MFIGVVACIFFMTNLKGSMATLFVVAVLALGALAFIDSSSVTGNVQGVSAGQPLGQGTVYGNIREDSSIYARQSYSEAENSNLENLVTDLLQFELEINCPGQTDPQAKAICARYSVSTS